MQLANQLRSLLESFWPGAARVFADVDSPIALAFIQYYPRPGSAARLGPKRMAAFRAQHAYSGRRSADKLVARLHQTPAGALGELEIEAKGELALSLARPLHRLVDQIRLLKSRILAHTRLRIVRHAGTDRDRYDPALHGAAQLLIQTAEG
jgi:hypothetical protein